MTIKILSKRTCIYGVTSTFVPHLIRRGTLPAEKLILVYSNILPSMYFYVVIDAYSRMRVENAHKLSSRRPNIYEPISHATRPVNNYQFCLKG